MTHNVFYCLAKSSMVFLPTDEAHMFDFLDLLLFYVLLFVGIVSTDDKAQRWRICRQLVEQGGVREKAARDDEWHDGRS